MSRLENDPEYQRKKAAFHAEVQERASVLRAAEQPIVADLRAAGVSVDSVWDLVNTSEPYPNALPVLIEHLERGGYPDRVVESLGRALAVKPAVAFWRRLKALYMTAHHNSGKEDGAAVALAACATKEQLDDLIAFSSMNERGQSRIYFVRPILRLGGERGRHVVEKLRSDPVFGKEASALLPARNRQVGRSVPSGRKGPEGHPSCAVTRVPVCRAFITQRKSRTGRWRNVSGVDRVGAVLLTIRKLIGLSGAQESRFGGDP